MFYEHYLKESFFPLVKKYQFMVRLLPEYPNTDGEKDRLLTFFWKFKAPGTEFGIDTEDEITHYWELINYVDEAELGMEMLAMDIETGKVKAADDKKFGFNWIGEYDTDTFLTIDSNTFLEYLELVLDAYPNNEEFNLENLRNTRVIKDFIKR